MIQQLLTISSGIAIGTFIEGGYFAGYISNNQDGVATHGLIVCPNLDGNNSGNPLQWKTSNTTTSGTVSFFDGTVNNTYLANSLHPAANYCANLTTNGYNDWYLPSLYELDIAYANLRATNATPSNSSLNINLYAVPQRTSSHTAGQTSVTDFQAGGPQALTNYHWSSSQSIAVPAEPDRAWLLEFSSGLVGTSGFTKTDNAYIRAFRRFAV